MLSDSYLAAIIQLLSYLRSCSTPRCPATAAAHRRTAWQRTPLRQQHPSSLPCLASAPSQLLAGVLPPPEERLRPLLNLAARGVALQFLMEHRLLGPGAVWQGGWQQQLARLALAAVATAAARTLRAAPRRPRWPAAGAPRRQPLRELLADALVSGATVYASLEVTRIPALYQALFGHLAPSWLIEMAKAGHRLLIAALDTLAAESKLVVKTNELEVLFRARPKALAALHAALLAGQACGGGGGLAGI